MKQKKLGKKLVLHKKTITNINNDGMKYVHAGEIETVLGASQCSPFYCKCDRFSENIMSCE